MSKQPKGIKRPRWVFEDWEFLGYWFPIKSNVWIARRMGRTRSAIASVASRLGLRKPPEYLTSMGRKNISGRWGKKRRKGRK